MFRRWPLLLLLLLAISASLHAAVDLVTLPTRDATQLTIYNSEDITMVREHPRRSRIQVARRSVVTAWAGVEGGVCWNFVG
jgi:hypothetical protein